MHSFAGKLCKPRSVIKPVICSQAGLHKTIELYDISFQNVATSFGGKKKTTVLGSAIKPRTIRRTLNFRITGSSFGIWGRRRLKSMLGFCLRVSQMSWSWDSSSSGLTFKLRLQLLGFNPLILPSSQTSHVARENTLSFLPPQTANRNLDVGVSRTDQQRKR